MSKLEASPLIVSVSGVRGVVGASLTPEVILRFAACYGFSIRGGTVVVSRDGRSTGDMLAEAVKAGLRAVGCDVVDVGVASTPTVGYFIKHTGAAGGVQISASHNPPEWNGLKLYRPEGFVVSPEAGRVIAQRFHQTASASATSDIEKLYVDWNRVGTEKRSGDPHGPHLARVMELVDPERIRRRKFRVLLDANHGSGGTFGPRLLEMLGCEFEVLGNTPDGQFEHPPEPIAENLKDLCLAVKHCKADIGFAVDPDADRLAIVDEGGRYIGEELTLALALLHRTAETPGTVVMNLSTSLASEVIAKRQGCKVVRTPVGEVHVAERMIAESAVLGGEGNGGVIDPRVGYIRDSAIGMAMVLDLLATRQCSLSSLVGEIPKFTLVKTKFAASAGDLPAVFAKIETSMSGAEVDRQDGLRLAWPDAWVQIRASNTEPIVRVFAESETAARAESLCRQVGDILTQARQ